MSPFYVWETFTGCVIDGFAKLPAAVRVGWPALVIQPLALAGTASFLNQYGHDYAPLQGITVGLLLFYVISILYAPVYNRLMYRAATGERADPRWARYRLDGKAVSSGLAFATGILFMSMFIPLALAPAALAVSADVWAAWLGFLEEVRGVISISGIFEGSVEEAVTAMEEAVALQPSSIGAGVLFTVGLVLIIWMNTRLTYIVPLAAFQGQFFPYLNSFRLSRVRFWKLMFTKLLLLTAMFVITIVLFLPLLALAAGFAGFVTMLSGTGIAGALVMWLALNLYALWMLASLSSFHGRLYGLHIVVEELFTEDG